MSEYQLEIKQIVDYPRCRIYRQFMQTLLTDRNIRTSGGSGLFYYTVLSCYANFRTSYKRIDGINYTIFPGEWLCRINEITEWFRVRYHHQAISILQQLQDRHLITYSILGRGKLVKFRIIGWSRSNRILEYNAPCCKDNGFFFISVALANELVSTGRCSEMDAVLDLWINTVYNDNQVQGSEIGPVVYMRNATGNPLIGYAELAQRWGISKATAGRYIKKLCKLGYITSVSFAGTYGSAIYLQNYLSTMFQISDVIVDKDEIALALNIRAEVPEDTETMEKGQDTTVSESIYSVSNLHIDFAVDKVKKILAAQGFPCAACPEIQYKLLPLSDCKEVLKDLDKAVSRYRHFLLIFSCHMEVFRFEILLRPIVEKEV